MQVNFQKKQIFSQKQYEREKGGLVFSTGTKLASLPIYHFPLLTAIPSTPDSTTYQPNSAATAASLAISYQCQKARHFSETINWKAAPARPEPNSHNPDLAALKNAKLQ